MQMNTSHNGHRSGEPDAEGFYLGSVRIAQRALRTMIEQAALQTPGVVGLAPRARPSGLGRPIPWNGVAVSVRDQCVSIDLHLLAKRDANLARVGVQAQEAVAASVEHLLGMQVSEINIYIQDIV